MQPVITESILLFEYAVSYRRFLALPERLPNGSLRPVLLNWRGEELDVERILDGECRPDCPEEAVDMASLLLTFTTQNCLTSRCLPPAIRLSNITTMFAIAYTLLD